MTNYWLSVTTRENYNASVKAHFKIDGYRRNCEKRVKAIEVGNKFILYIMREYIFGGIYEAISKYDPNKKDKELEGLIWPSEKRANKLQYPLRFRIKPILVPQYEKLLDAKNIINNLPSVRNTKSWTWYVQNSIRNISREDFELIETEMKKKGSYKEV